MESYLKLYHIPPTKVENILEVRKYDIDLIFKLKYDFSQFLIVKNSLS